MTYERKIDFAIKLLRAIPQDGPIELSYSGGKDSDVILTLAKMAGIPFEAIYKNTTIDPPGTIAHCKENGVTILRPRMGFFELVEKNGLPSRWSRFCCSIMKEYKIRDRAIQGIRRSESTKRAQRYKEPEECRTYPKGEKARVYFPILEWKDDDVARFIDEQHIKCAPVYYDEQGTFHVERRLGCIGCPLATGNGRYDYLKYPKMLKVLCKHAQVYLDTHKHTNAYKRFGGDAYNLVFKRLFCNTLSEYDAFVTGGILPDSAVDTRAFMEDYFKIRLPDLNRHEPAPDTTQDLKNPGDNPCISEKNHYLCDV